MRQLADFVTRMTSEPVRGAAARDGSGNGHRSGRAIGVIGIPGDRRDEDQRAYGEIAASAFDELIVREDRNLRGRPSGESATNVVEGIRSARGNGGARARRAERILDELSAARTALRRARPGDLVVMCVDDAVAVYREAMALAGSSRGVTAFADPGELEAPEG
jgi:cyanophycin synthetase